MTDKKTTGPISVKKSFRDGCVGVGIKLKCGGWQSGSAKIEASDDLTVAQARALAASLISTADEVDAKATAREAKEGRRREWRDREIAAGRMVILGR